MITKSTFSIFLVFLCGNAAIFASLQESDPYIWLEEVEGPKALDWVRERNKESLSVFENDPRYEDFKKRAEELLQAPDRIPYGQLRGRWIYNFWQDKDHVRGLWRRARLDEYAKPYPQWDILLDVDALAAKENENWVYEESECLPPKQARCLVIFSRGGKDAHVVREFDTQKKVFVENGFALKEAKSDVQWIDEDTVLVGTDWGPGSLTASGYPRILKAWKRGTDAALAPTLFEGTTTDMVVEPAAFHRPEGRAIFFLKYITFYDSEKWLLTRDNRKLPIPLPTDAEIHGVFAGQVLATLRSDWMRPEGDLTAGSLVSLDASRIERTSDLRVETVFVPDARSAIRSVSTTRGFVLVNLLRNVQGEILAFQRTSSGWTSARRLSFPDKGSLSIISADNFEDDFLAGYDSFLTPPMLYLGNPGSKEPRVLKSLPERFDAKPYVAEQLEAKSKDGTLIPYFMVRRSDADRNGDNPVLLYGYGGFEIARTPSYAMMAGNLWLPQGGIYVLANIRGGGEFGPKWHQAALKERRQNAFDDFIGVAEDLIARKWTSSRRLGIMGGSNGGLLVGAVFTQRPELFNAAVCQVPLLDMLRYTKLPPGASWAGEYGDPDDPKLRPVIAAYSPYQNLRADRIYPVVFFNTSTKDDRVQPGHARKMVAKMTDMGKKVYYFENIEGGHSAAANLLQRAKRHALEYVYLIRQLKD